MSDLLFERSKREEAQDEGKEAEKKYKNKAECRKCGDIIESTYRHDFKECSCGAIFVDGGNDYWRCGGSLHDIKRIWEEIK